MKVAASIRQHIMQRLGDISRRQSADSLHRLRESEVLRHPRTACRSPRDLGGIAEASQYDIGKQSTFARRTKRVSGPPSLPLALPCGGFLFVVLNCHRWNPGRAQRLPGGIVPVLHWKPFFVKQRIPVVGKPLDQWKEIPVYRIDPPIGLLMGAQIPALDPDLESSPGCADIGIDAAPAIRIVSKLHL